MSREAQGDGALVVSMVMKALSKEIIGKFARLLKSKYTLGDFEVHPVIPCQCSEIVFLNEFVKDDGRLDLDIFRSVKGCTKVEVSNVKTGKGGT